MPCSLRSNVPYDHLLKKFPEVADWADPPEVILFEAFRILVGSSVGSSISSSLHVPEKHPFCNPSVIPFSLYLNFYQ